MNVTIKNQDVSRYITEATLSSDVKQAAVKLELTLLQDDRDEKLPAFDIDNGYTLRLRHADYYFQGNIYELERSRANSTLRITAYDNLFVLNRSKSTKKFTDALPEDIARKICAEMGVKVGNIAETNQPVSFIANGKTGFQIIMTAYYEAHKKNNQSYQLAMRGDELDVIEKGTLLEFKIDSRTNMTESVYRESITELINRVLIVDSEGNQIGEAIDDAESIGKYSRFQTIYREAKDKDTQTEAKDLLTKPKREGNITCLGDLTLRAGYSVEVRDSLFRGKFYIKSANHHFLDNHIVSKLKLEFELLMEEP